MEDEVCIAITTESDIVVARRRARALAEELGFNGSDPTIIATAISEVARNIVQYARRGEIILRSTNRNPKAGILMIARDQGPGIPDIPKALEDGYSSSAGLGLGLPGARRLVDHFNIESKPGSGTTVTMIKWIHADEPGGWSLPY